jgi:NADPH:quinone reductase-like Zn-dependent oxidoreductase
LVLIRTGTGGVSIFALLLCIQAGIRVIITSSSDEKLRKVKDLGPPGSIETVNYKTFPNWEDEVKRLTDGRGVDTVIETGGPTTIVQSLHSLVRRGTISLIGILGGLQMDQYPDAFTPLLLNTATIK